MKLRNAEETWVRRWERELKDFVGLFRRNRVMALLLVCAVCAYIGVTYWPAPWFPEPLPETMTLPNPARIRNPLEMSVKLAVGGGAFETIQAGGELPIIAPKDGTVVRLESCGWVSPPCKERPYPVFAGQHWRVTLEEPYPRIGLLPGD